jgi:hypothetical protein
MPHLTTGKYILDGHTPIEEPDLFKWGKWFGTVNRHVANDNFKDRHGNSIQVSTVFLGMDHSFSTDEDHIPILFETMIFGGEHNEDQYRYCTWDEAVIGHKIAILKARGEYDGVLEVYSQEKI